MPSIYQGVFNVLKVLDFCISLKMLNVLSAPFCCDVQKLKTSVKYFYMKNYKSLASAKSGLFLFINPACEQWTSPIDCV